MIDTSDEPNDVSLESGQKQTRPTQQAALNRQPFVRVLTVMLVAHGLLLTATLAAMIHGGQNSLGDSLRWGLRVYFLGSLVVFLVHNLAVVLLRMPGGFQGGWVTCLPILGPRITVLFFNKLRAVLRNEGFDVGLWNVRAQ